MKKVSTGQFTPRIIQKAMREAVKKLLIERKKNGVSLSVWKNGKLVTIPGSKINTKQLD